MNSDELIRGMAEDRAMQCLGRNMVTNTDFLDAHQQSVLRLAFREPRGCGILFWGGYEDADRRIMVCLPDYADMEAEYVTGLLSVIRAEHSARSAASRTERKLSHGDYLGALMGLGLKREMIGDILVRPEGADILVLSRVADYVLQNFSQAGRTNLSLTLLPVKELIVPVREGTLVRDTVASLRLDGIVASAFGLSRGRAAEAVRSGLVFVDHMECLETDRPVEEGSEIVLRHKGKVILEEVGGTSRKGRINILLKKL
nr:YlmH/Sll1252 family protein [uncultured Eubacterium sp.]